jgi:hypothetical protein
MVTARRFAPGVFTTPAQAGAKAIPVCRLSGLRATSGCAQLTEWFAAGTEPGNDDWERAGGGRPVLPQEYATWARPEVVIATEDVASPMAHSDTAEAEPAKPQFRIVSPMDGDHYVVPSGAEARYATISLRAVGAGDAGVRWSVDGRAYSDARWRLSPGAHVIAARSAGRTAEVRIVVE